MHAIPSMSTFALFVVWRNRMLLRAEENGSRSNLSDLVIRRFKQWIADGSPDDRPVLLRDADLFAA
jgi:hypothetical protein